MGIFDRLWSWAGGGKGGKEVRVLVLGLDNSGKTSLLNALRAPEQRATHIAPTVGHQQDNFTSNGVSFAAWDVSGARRHRMLWERHYRSTNAIIFVVDSADHLRLVVAADELSLVLAHPDICGRRIPLLIFANKSDSPHALGETQIAIALGLHRAGDNPWHVCASSALSGSGVTDGISWLARQLREQLMKQ